MKKITKPELRHFKNLLSCTKSALVACGQYIETLQKKYDDAIDQLAKLLAPAWDRDRLLQLVEVANDRLRWELLFDPHGYLVAGFSRKVQDQVLDLPIAVVVAVKENGEPQTEYKRWGEMSAKEKHQVISFGDSSLATVQAQTEKLLAVSKRSGVPQWRFEPDGSCVWLPYPMRKITLEQINDLNRRWPKPDAASIESEIKARQIAA